MDEDYSTLESAWFSLLMRHSVERLRANYELIGGWDERLTAIIDTALSVSEWPRQDAGLATPSVLLT